MAEKRRKRKNEADNPQQNQPGAQAQPETIRVLFVEDTTGEQYECKVPVTMMLSQVAGDFFESQGWETHDARGQAQRAVVELVDRDNRDRTQRLRGDETVGEAGLQDGDILRIFPESVAGVLNLPALIQDLNGMNELAGWNPRITFQAKPESAPTYYLVTLDYPGFRRLEGNRPVKTREPHQVEIWLGTNYPREAPLVRWKTEIFHPNINPEHRGVCLGVLMERWLPGFGIPRLVIMLAEIAQWRNFDITHAFNKAAAGWASEPENMKYVLEIGGAPDQHPIGEWLKMFERQADKAQRIMFKKVDNKRKS